MPIELKLPDVGEVLYKGERIDGLHPADIARRGIGSAFQITSIFMELGNNSGTIIEPDADLSAAVPRCVMSSFANSGQMCISLQRLYVHKAVAKEFTKRFVEETKKLKVGNPLEKDCDVGPMIEEKEAIRAEAWVKEASRKGRRCSSAVSARGG